MTRRFVQLSPFGLATVLSLGAVVWVTADLGLNGYFHAALAGAALVALMVGVAWADAAAARTGVTRKRPGGIWHRLEDRP